MILYDYQIFINQNYGGISVYFGELIKNLVKEKINCKIGINNSDNITFNTVLSNLNCIPKRFAKIPRLHDWVLPKPFLGKGRLYKTFYGDTAFKSNYNLEHKKELLRSLTLEELKSKKYKIFHPTYYSDYYLENIKYIAIPFIITVYDMIHEKFPLIFSNRDETLENKKKLCEAATKIITISNSTKKDLIEVYHIPESKITTIYLGNDWELINSINKFDKEYILYVGDRLHYKNFLLFIKAIHTLLHDEDLYLVCAGSHDFNGEEKDILKELEINSRVFHINFHNQNELKSLYRNAKVFVFPSLYEGFGLPLLEAQSQRTPIACSCTSSFKEVAGSGAVYFDPYDFNSIRENIKDLLKNKKLQNEIVNHGSRNHKKFSWGISAQHTLKVYNSIT